MAQCVVDQVAERLAAAQRIDAMPAARPARRRGSRGPARAARSAKRSRGALEQLADLDTLLGPHGQLPVGGARDQQQILGELRQVVRLLERGDERLAHAAAVALRRAHRRLELGLQDRERRAQLVARVGDELALALEGVLEPREHLVERLPEPADLVVRLRQRQALAAARSARSASRAARIASTGRNPTVASR